ncbi:hypothetical protein [Aliivibrio salmonicida]|uniref:hypothetical protein n=1 Tax=Aliivibrio salmonicida TaxID=40269 RepID=UPI003D0A93CA
MNKFIFVIFFIALNAWSAPRIPLVFQLTSSITQNVLDYKITNVSFFPDSVLLKYDKDTKTFMSVDLSLNVETNIPVDEGADNFTYSLSLIENKSVCINGNDEVIESLPPNIMLNKELLELNVPVTSLGFESEIDSFLSDKNDVTLLFEELDKSIASCSGDISVEVGVDI